MRVLPREKFSLETDLDEESWSLFRQRANIPADMDPVTALRNLHLMTDNGHMSHAGAWLLTHDIRKFNISADARETGDVICGQQIPENRLVPGLFVVCVRASEK